MTLPEGFVDLHVHVVPGIDDGPATVADAVELVRAAAEAGTGVLVATSHSEEVLEGHYSLERLKGRLEPVQAALAHDAGIPMLLLGCEVFLELQSPQLIADGVLPTLNASRYVLVEPPLDQLPLYFDETLFQLHIRGFVPVLAHPERNARIQQRPEQLGDWCQRGYLVQITASSFLGEFGSLAKTVAHTAVSRGWCHVVASDGHGAAHRSPQLRGAYNTIVQEFGAQAAHMLFIDNPRAIIEDREVHTLPAKVVSKKTETGGWMRFLRGRGR
ncbi:MAG: hypothetical protein M1118_05060 [Chloroflexi bacterium]|nr:hypothetical protein [Chloroflexota bacterium]